MTVTADGTGQTTARAQLNVDSNPTDFVDLSPGDTLTAGVGAPSQPMSRSDLLGAITYETSFAGHDAAGTQYVIALNRKSDTSAPSSTCTLPSPFAITQPAATASYSRASADVVVTYGPSGTSDSVSYSAQGDCIKDTSTTTINGDPGTFTIAKGTLAPVDTSHATSTCPVTITITRARRGQLDRAYGAGGSIVAQQTRTVTWSSAP